MGQLERYGLYVLCLVIFLILGIAIWGDSLGPAISHDTSGQSLQATSATGPEDVISREQAKRLEEEANINDVVKIMAAYSDPVQLPLYRVDPNKKPAGTTEDRSRTPLPVSKTSPKVRIHVVKQYETLEEISLHYLGKRHLWRRILALNPRVRPTALQPGTKLMIPPRQTGNTAAGVLPTTVRVQRGDSPGLISQRLFGTTRYAEEIMRLNNVQDPRRLQIGALLKVPQVDVSKAKN